MNPLPMNRGYRRLFWASLFILVWESAGNEYFPWAPGLIGLCVAVSGTGIICGTSDSKRFGQARIFGIAGVVIWLLQWLILIPFFGEHIPWEARFLSYFLGAVIILQIYVNVLMGAGELLGGSWKHYFTKRAAVFAGMFTITTVAAMLREVYGSTAGSALDVVFNVLIGLQIIIGLWIMWLMADLRRQYPPELG